MKVYVVKWFCGDGSNDITYDPEVCGVFSSEEVAKSKIMNLIISELDACAHDETPTKEEMKNMSFEKLSDIYAEYDSSFEIQEFTIDDKIVLSQ